jgi:hypothetical protein
MSEELGYRKYYKLPNDGELLQLVHPTDVWGPCTLQGKFHSFTLPFDTLEGLYDSNRPSRATSECRKLDMRDVQLGRPTLVTISYPFCHIYTRTEATPSVCFNANPSNGGC